MATISGANKRNRAQISATGRKFRKEVWPIELKEHFFKISSTSKLKIHDHLQNLPRKLAEQFDKP
jgi:hypothetical protein